MGARDQELITRLERIRNLSLKYIGERGFFLVLALVTWSGRGSAKCLLKTSSVGNE